MYKTEAINNSRVGWVDIFKAIVILLMVAGHAGSPINTYIYLFHMPAFIFISGYTYTGDKYKFWDYFKKKVKFILIPMIIINLIYILFYDIMSKAGIYQYFQVGEKINLGERLNLFFRYVGTPDLGGATWFLLVLFSVEILFKLISEISKKFKYYIITILLGGSLSIIGWYAIFKQITLPYLMDISLFGCIFFTMGVATKKYNILSRYIDEKVMMIFSSIVVVILGSFYFKDNIPMNWPTRQFPSLFINLLGTICGIYLCYILSRILEGSPLFNKTFIYIGQRTYSILIGHFFVFKIIFGVGILLGIYPVEYLKELVPRYSAGLQWIIITILTTIITILISNIASKNRTLNYIFNARIDQRKESI